jgi:hypothetical protein
MPPPPPPPEERFENSLLSLRDHGSASSSSPLSAGFVYQGMENLLALLPLFIRFTHMFESQVIGDHQTW